MNAVHTRDAHAPLVLLPERVRAEHALPSSHLNLGGNLLCARGGTPASSQRARQPQGQLSMAHEEEITKQGGNHKTSQL